MKLLNVGCGGQRPGPPWVNLDTLQAQLAVGTPERTNLDKEPNYVECDLLTQSIPFPNEYFDGILLQHVLEHFTCHDAVDVILSCKAVLKPGGVLVASVPNADYFIQVHGDDDVKNAVVLFGEPISEPEHKTFFSYALFHRDHKQILNRSGLWALLRRAAFDHSSIRSYARHDDTIYPEIVMQFNRLKFSSILYAYK